MRLLSFHLVAPRHLEPIANATHGLREGADAVGATFSAHDIRTRAELRTAWEAIPQDASPVLLVLSGHGMRKRVGDQQEATNLLLAGDTDPSEISATSVDLDGLVHALRRRGGAWLLVIDAGPVDVRTSLGEGAPVAVLLANPDHAAEAVREAPVLARAFGRALVEAGRTGASLDQIVQRVVEDVQRETGGRQHPALRVLGSREFLSQRPRSRVPGSGGSAALAARLATLAGTDALPPDVLRALDEVVAAHDTDPVLGELALGLAARRVYPHAEPAEIQRLEMELHQRRGASDAVVAAAQHWHGWALNKLGDAEGAVGALSSALRKLQNVGAPSLEARVCNTLATAHRSMFSFAKAEEYYTRSLHLKQEAGDRTGIEITRQMLGWLRFAQGRFEEAARTFAEGLEVCARALGDTTWGYDAPARLSMLESLLFHLVGRCTALLVLPTDERVFRRLREELAEWVQLYRPFRRWGGAGPVEEALFLLSLGARDGKIYDPPPGTVSEWWPAVRRVRTEGAGDLAPLERLLLRTPSPGDLLPARMKELAGLHHLCLSMSGDALPALRDAHLRRLGADRFHAIPAPGSPPWTWSGAALRLDTGGWCEWGPLRGQLAEILRPNTLLTPAATEQYLQVLAWVSALFLLLDGGLPADRARVHLAQNAGKSRDAHLSLGAAIGLCRAVAAETAPRTDWGRRLAVVWLSGTGPAEFGYPGWADIATERNVLAHRRLPTLEETQHLLHRHAGLVRLVSKVLDSADVHAHPGPEVGPPEAPLHVVQLRTSRQDLGPTMDCGPFLLVHAHDRTAFYVPHRLPAALLAGEPATGLQYQRYAQSAARVAETVTLSWGGPATR